MKFLKRLAFLVLLASSAILNCGCAQITKAIHDFTPEISVGVWKDDGKGVTLGVKLSGAKPVEEQEPSRSEEK